MPNYRMHTTVGATVGVACATLNSLDQSGFDLMAEAIGGCCGGALGGALPDIFDPPIHPRHRSLGHGIVQVGAGFMFWTDNLKSWQGSLRRSAGQHHAQQISATNDLDALLHMLAEWIFRFLAGFVAGIGAGYISHIILDFGTPGCIPLVT